MTIAELVKRMLEAGASPDVVEIAIQALEEEREEAQPARRRRNRKRPEVVAQRA